MGLCVPRDWLVLNSRTHSPIVPLHRTPTPREMCLCQMVKGAGDRRNGTRGVDKKLGAQESKKKWHLPIHPPEQG
jgi:hypothetical protein